MLLQVQQEREIRHQLEIELQNSRAELNTIYGRVQDVEIFTSSLLDEKKQLEGQLRYIAKERDELRNRFEELEMKGKFFRSATLTSQVHQFYPLVHLV